MSKREELVEITTGITAEEWSDRLVGGVRDYSATLKAMSDAALKVAEAIEKAREPFIEAIRILSAESSK